MCVLHPPGGAGKIFLWWTIGQEKYITSSLLLEKFIRVFPNVEAFANMRAEEQEDLGNVGEEEEQWKGTRALKKKKGSGIR